MNLRRGSLAGHLWTIRGYIKRQRLEVDLPGAEDWSTELLDPTLGRLRLTGRLVPAGEDVVVIVHGLGGCADSGYVRLAAAAAAAADMASLSLNVRGADRKGEDYFHAALTADIEAAVSDPALDRYERIFLLGYSLGGHMALCYVGGSADPRVHALVAVCPPLDLAACCDHIDRPAAVLYRRYLLERLSEIYTEVARRRDVPLSVEAVRRIRTQREFDDRVVAPRHGFDGVDDYYRRASVGPRLGRLRVPTLLVLAEQDPMVPAASLRPFLDPPPAGIEAHWTDGGHVGFPADLDLGQPVELGLEAQILSWLRSVSAPPC